MRITQLTSWLSRRGGGVFGVLPPLASALRARNDCRVEAWGLWDDCFERDHQTWQGVPTRVFAPRGPRALGYAPRLAPELRTEKPDLVHTHGLWMYPSIVAQRFSAGTGRPYVVSPHGMLDPWALQNAYWKKRLASLLYENAHLRHAACLHATSEMEARHFRRYGQLQRIAVIPNGVDTPAPTDLIQGGGLRTVLFLSRLHPKKGLPLLVRAWKGVQARHEDWRLVVAGPNEGNHEQHVRRLVQELEARRVEFPGPAYGAERDALYDSADLFVLPTHTENFGLVVAEALAHGVPVITTTGAPWQGLQEHRCGWWIDLTVEDLAHALDEAMAASDEERRAMGARGRAWMGQDFSWPAVARQMQAVYTWILGGGAPPPCVMTD